MIIILISVTTVYDVGDRDVKEKRDSPRYFERFVGTSHDQSGSYRASGSPSSFPRCIVPHQGEREAPSHPHTTPCPYPFCSTLRVPYGFVSGKMRYRGLVGARGSGMGRMGPRACPGWGIECFWEGPCLKPCRSSPPFSGLLLWRTNNGLHSFKPYWVGSARPFRPQ